MGQRLGQKKSHSWLETFTNIAIGMGINTVAQFLVFPAIGMQVTTQQQFEIVVIFTLISVARQYTLRRIYNWWTIKQQV